MGNEKMMRVSDLFRKYSWIAWVMIAFGLALYVANEAIEPKPPLRFIGGVAKPPEVPVGQMATITYKSVRERTCTATINKGWVDSIGSVALRLPPTIGGLGRLGEQTNSITVPVPDLPGHYCFRLIGHHQCGDSEFTIAAPEACLRVVP